MTTHTSTSDPTTTTRRGHVAGAVILAVLTAVNTVIGGSAAFFSSDPDTGVLAATFAVGMGAVSLVLILTHLRRGDRAAWLALWVFPLFYLSHVIAFHTVIPDGIFAVLAGLALVLTRPGATHRGSTPPQR